MTQKMKQAPTQRTKLAPDVETALQAISDKAELDDKARRTVSADLLSRAVMLDVTYHQWTNRAKADRVNTTTAALNSGKAAKLLRTTMKMIESPAFDAIVSRTNETRKWILERSMPSFINDGIFFVLLGAVDEFERTINDFNTWLDVEGVPALVADYDRAKRQARQDFDDVAIELGIESPYKEMKYPAPADLRSKFGIDHSWVTFGVPESLPQAIREQESIKIRAKFDSAADEISAALREGFAELITHAADLLTTKPGEKKVVKEALVDNFRNFCDTFKFRNLTDDRELADLVAQAEAIMSNTSAKTLRDTPTARRAVVKQLTTIKASLDEMVVNAPKRKFDLDALDD